MNPSQSGDDIWLARFIGEDLEIETVLAEVRGEQIGYATRIAWWIRTLQTHCACQQANNGRAAAINLVEESLVSSSQRPWGTGLRA